MKSERHKKCEWESKKEWEKGTIDTVYCKAWNCWQASKQQRNENWNLAVRVIRHDVDAYLMRWSMYLPDMSMALNWVVNVLSLSHRSADVCLITHMFLSTRFYYHTVMDHHANFAIPSSIPLHRDQTDVFVAAC